MLGADRVQAKLRILAKASIDKLAEHFGVGERTLDVCCGAVGVDCIVYPVGDRCQEPVDLFGVGCRFAAVRELSQQCLKAVDVTCNVLTGSMLGCFQSLDVLLELLVAVGSEEKIV